MKSLAFIFIALTAAAAYAGQDAPTPAAKTAAAPDHRHVQPLDHGPRAQSTPWLNEQARQREAKAAEATRQAALAQGQSANGGVAH